MCSSDLATKEKGFFAMAAYVAGTRSFYAKKTITRPDDLQGMKIRVQASPTTLRMIELMGGSPTPVSFGEVYTAMQQGVVDGAENNIPSWVQTRHIEIARVFSEDEHTAIPDFLVLDEPTAGLDPKGRDEILDQLALLHKTRGISVVLVSHSMEDIAKYVERIIVMNHGHVAFDDTPKKVFAHYKELEKIGLAAPQMTYIMHALKEHGMDVDVTATTVEEARDTILAALESQKKNGKKGAEVC